MFSSPSYRSKFTGLVLLALTFLLMVACGGEEEPTPTPEPTAVAEVAEPTAEPTEVPPTNTPEPTATPTEGPSSTPEPTAGPTEGPSSTPEFTATPTEVLPTNTPAPTNTPTTPPPTIESDVSFQGVSFLFSNPLPQYNRAVSEKIAAEPRTPAVGFDRGNPDYLRFYFGDTPPSLDFFQPREPQILIYPVDDYVALFPEAADQFNQFETWLATAPNLIAEPLPFLPLTGSEETFSTKVGFVTFQNGRGVRYVTQRDQLPGPITNESIFYTFQGLTNDGQFYVTAFFPLTVEGLPATFQDADLNVFASEDLLVNYYETTVTELSDLPDQAYMPDLGNLDVVIESITAAPADLASAPAVSQVDNAAPVDADGQPVEPTGETAVISGEINYPVGDGSLLKVYAVDPTRPEAYYFLETFDNSYALQVSPGNYQIIAYAADTLLPGGYTQRVVCRIEAGDTDTVCPDQSLAFVTAEAGQTITNININDWDIPDDVDFPAPPDGSTAVGTTTNIEIIGQVFGAINYFTTEIPPLRVYAQEVTTQDYYRTETAANQNDYILDLPAGTYNIFAYTFDGATAGGYTEGDSNLLTITITDTATLTNIDLDNFNTPPLGLIPAQPDVAAAVTPTPTGTAPITPTTTITPTEGVTIEEGLGQILGALSAPDGSDNVPAMTIYVQGLTNSQLYTLNLDAGFTSYFIEVATGQYAITAVTADGQFYGGYTEASLCADPSACTDHTLRIVTIAENGASFTTADITDWNVPPESVPN